MLRLHDSRESWLLNGLFEYHINTGSIRTVEILVGVREPHDRYLFDKISEYIRGPQKVQALTLLSHVVHKHPTWLYKIVHHQLIKDLLKLLKRCRLGLSTDMNYDRFEPKNSEQEMTDHDGGKLHSGSRGKEGGVMGYSANLADGEDVWSPSVFCGAPTPPESAPTSIPHTPIGQAVDYAVRTMCGDYMAEDQSLYALNVQLAKNEEERKLETGSNTPNVL
ncbi:hypothetical protein AAG570_012343 [Ranatra chinensis]|uniref:Uncharacterized protein n=1 Tax=Ranatra chinensis TaxID=642074 RepID=A0ABD0YIT7_9HEMI